MAETVRAAKAALRKTISTALKSVSNDSITQQSQRAVATVLKLEQYQTARRLSVYLSMPGHEIQTRGIVLDALKTGKKVFVPYITQSSPVMNMLALRDLEDYESLEKDRWGIPSLPVQSVPDRESWRGGLDMILVPGVAFDARCRRLGHGKGYYDRFLSEYQEKETRIEDGNMPPLGRCFHFGTERGAICSDFNSRTQRGSYLHLDLTPAVAVGLALTEQLLPPKDDIPTTLDDWLVDAVVSGDRDVLWRETR